MKNVLLVFLGGGLGSALRYLTVLGVARLTVAGGFPWGVLVANLAGSFVLGLLFGLPAMRSKDSSAWLFAATGVLGGFTTFSTLANDSWVLFVNNRSTLALLNGLGSTVLGIMAAALGWHTARTIGS